MLQGRLVPGLAPRSPVCTEKSLRPLRACCPPRGPRGLAPPCPCGLTPSMRRPCPPSARAVPVLSSPSLPTSAHPVLAPTTTAYHPPYPGGQFLSEFLPTQSALPGQAHRTEGLEPILITHPTRRRGVWCPYLNAQPPIYNPHSRSPDQEVPLHRSYDSGSGARRRIAPCSTEWSMCSVKCKNIKEQCMLDICF